MQDITRVIEIVANSKNKTATFTKLKNNKAKVEIYLEDKKTRYRLTFKSQHSAKNFLDIVNIKNYKIINEIK